MEYLRTEFLKHPFLYSYLAIDIALYLWTIATLIKSKSSTNTKGIHILLLVFLIFPTYPVFWIFVITINQLGVAMKRRERDSAI